MPESPLSLSTTLVHGSEKPDAQTGAVAPVVVRSKTYRQPAFGEDSRWKYARGTNPTRSALEAKLESIEGEGHASVFGSGNAAMTCLLLTLSPGDHILFSSEIYGGTYRLLDQLFCNFGLTFSFADFNDEAQTLAAITPNTKYLFLETPSNPSVHVVDLEVARAISQKSGVPLIVDGTFAPPVTTRAFEWGAETILYSLSKYFSGHNDTIGGAILTKNEALHTRLKWMQGTVGAVLSPDECYRVLQGVKTLHMRWERVSQSAQKVAEFLSAHGAIKRALYPGLPSHPHHAAAARQMENGFGGVVAFETHCHESTRLKTFVDALEERGTIVYAESLASPETILSYPLHMSHRAVSPADLTQLQINAGFFRLSLGFEDATDIIEDLRRGLATLEQ